MHRIHSSLFGLLGCIRNAWCFRFLLMLSALLGHSFCKWPRCNDAKQELFAARALAEHMLYIICCVSRTRGQIGWPATTYQIITKSWEIVIHSGTTEAILCKKIQREVDAPPRFQQALETLQRSWRDMNRLWLGSRCVLGRGQSWPLCFRVSLGRNLPWRSLCGNGTSQFLVCFVAFMSDWKMEKRLSQNLGIKQLAGPGCRNLLGPCVCVGVCGCVGVLVVCVLVVCVCVLVVCVCVGCVCVCVGCVCVCWLCVCVLVVCVCVGCVCVLVVCVCVGCVCVCVGCVCVCCVLCVCVVCVCVVCVVCVCVVCCVCVVWCVVCVVCCVLCVCVLVCWCVGVVVWWCVGVLVVLFCMRRSKREGFAAFSVLWMRSCICMLSSAPWSSCHFQKHPNTATRCFKNQRDIPAISLLSNVVPWPLSRGCIMSSFISEAPVSFFSGGKPNLSRSPKKIEVIHPPQLFGRGEVRPTSVNIQNY